MASTITIQLTDQDEADFKFTGFDATDCFTKALNTVRSQASAMRLAAVSSAVTAMDPASASAMSSTLETTVAAKGPAADKSVSLTPVTK